MKQREFANPPDVYRGLDLWMVNDWLEDEELVHQVREFHDKGLYSVIFRTYNGLYSDYPGPDFHHKVRVAVDAARECGLKIVLQAGYMPSAFPDLPPQYALHRIVPTPVAGLKGNEKILLCRNGLAYVDGLSPSAVNMLDAASTRYYIQKTYEEMWQDFREDFGKTVISVWVDEPRFDNRCVVWTPSMEEDYREKYGESLTEHLDALYDDTGDWKTIRYRYFAMLREKMERHYFIPVRDWCHRHGLSLSGHMMGEELLKYQVSQGCALMPFYPYFDIPGIDMLGANHEWSDRPRLSPTFSEQGRIVSTLQCVSAALQAGKKHILCEMYGVTSPGFEFRDMMHLFDFFAANGINHQCMHALFYSLGGFRKRFYPQQINVYQPFWPNFRQLKDYVARTSQFVSAGTPQVDTVLIHPLETAWLKARGLKNPEDTSPRDVIDAYDESFDRTVLELYGAQIPFHFGDQTMIAQSGSVSDGRFRIGEMAYRRVVLPELEVLNRKTWELLRTFAQNGGEVYVLGACPDRLDGELYPELPQQMAALPVKFVKDSESLTRLLRKADIGYRYIAQDTRSAVNIHHNVDGSTHYFMLYSDSCRAAQYGELRVPGRFRAQRLDAETGVISGMECRMDAAETVVPVQIGEGGSVLIQLIADAAAPEVRFGGTAVHPLPSLQCTPEYPNVLTLELCSYRTADMADFSPEYAVECVTELLKRQNYVGEVTLRFRFASAFAAKGIRLAIEEPEVCSVALNGVPVSPEDQGYYFAKSFRLLTLPDCIRAGENVLEITRSTKPQVQARICDDMKHLFELFRAPVGVDLERIHLVGDFLVDTVSQYARNGLVRCAKEFCMTEYQKPVAASNMTVHGFPFYIGSMVFSAAATLRRPEPEAVLRVRELNGCTAEVFVNGRRMGSLNRRPYSLAIGSALKVGENAIALRLYSTLRNAIGPSHRSDRDPSNCWRGLWPDPLLPVSKADTENWTGDFCLVPFGIGGVLLETPCPEL